jgi:exo beta-1,2-glucooligosaccharide sophorohydrolase (non-reducing end)
MLRKRLLLLFCCISLVASSQEYEYTYTFFTNSAMPGEYLFSRTASAGGSSVKNINGRIPVNEAVFHTPGNSLELEYQNAAGGHWQAIIFHYDLRGMDHFKKTAFLSFWIYSTSEINMPGVQLMIRDSSTSAVVEPPGLKGNRWQHVMIPLYQFKTTEAYHPENIIGIVLSQNNNPEAQAHKLYLDDIELIPDNQSLLTPQIPKISLAKGYALHADISWEPVTDQNTHLIKIYRSENGGEFIPVGVVQPFLSRYTDFTGETGKNYTYRITALNRNYIESGVSLAVKASTTPMTDDELLTMVQEACFRYYWEGAEEKSGMARENIPGRQNMIATGASGFGIMALVVGTERNFITRDESVDRFLQILAFLEKADRFHGVYGHFMDGPTGKVEPFFGSRDNGADLVETSFLLEGLLAARQYFSCDNDKEKLIREKITKIWEEAEFDWFRKEPGSKFLYWHWSPDQGWVINHRLIGWNETMIVYLLAISSPTHAVPTEMYYSGWASQDKDGQRYRSNWGDTKEGSMYTNGNTYFGIKLDVGVSNGGPLFFTHYSYMGCDPHFITDKYTNYFNNNTAIAKINYNYCVANPNHYKGYGEHAWGLTASDGPYDYSADEPVKDRDKGKLAPTGAISSFPYTPEESMQALKNYYYNYGSFLWGEYGFKDAFNLTENWCSEIYMGLNQAPMVVMIENYRTGLVWKLFMQNEEIQEGLKKLAEAKSE